MPFQSPKQERFLWARHPDIARRWTAEHGSVRGKGKDSRVAQSAFDRLAGKLASRKGVGDSKALAAYIGRKKYGAAGMAKKAAAGRRKKRRRHH